MSWEEIKKYILPYFLAISLIFMCGLLGFILAKGAM